MLPCPRLRGLLLPAVGFGAEGDGFEELAGDDYNENRPHSAHGDLTPTEFATAWTTNHITQPQAA